jgi:RNA polymerase sigma-70 factor, ECF subfamily
MESVQANSGVEESLDIMTDEELVKVLKWGNTEACNILDRRYRSEIFRFLRGKYKNSTLVDEMVNGALGNAMKKIGTFEDGRVFKSWLYAIASHYAVDVWRREQRHAVASLNESRSGSDEVQLAHLLESTDMDPSDYLEMHEEYAKLNSALAQISDIHRQVVTLVYYHGLLYREAAEELHIPLGTVKSRLHTAIRELSQIFEVTEKVA